MLSYNQDRQKRNENLQKGQPLCFKKEEKEILKEKDFGRQMLNPVRSFVFYMRYQRKTGPQNYLVISMNDRTSYGVKVELKFVF